MKQRSPSFSELVVPEHTKGLLFLIAVFWISDAMLQIPLEHVLAVALVAAFAVRAHQMRLLGPMESAAFLLSGAVLSISVWKMLTPSWLLFVADLLLLGCCIFSVASFSPADRAAGNSYAPARTNLLQANINAVFSPTTFVGIAAVLDFVLAANFRTFPYWRGVLALSAGFSFPLFVLVRFSAPAPAAAAASAAASATRHLKRNPALLAALASRKVHAHFLCPITHEVMEDPVTAADGHTYDRFAIEEWLKTHRTSPMTNEVLSSQALVPNVALRRMILEEIQDVQRVELAQDQPFASPVGIGPLDGVNPDGTVSNLTSPSVDRRARFNAWTNAKRRLCLGSVFTKYGRHGDPKRRYVVLSADAAHVEWWNEDRSGKLLGSMRVVDLIGVRRGRRTKVFQKATAAMTSSAASSAQPHRDEADADSRCFSLVSEERTLDLECASYAERDQCAADFEVLIRNAQAAAAAAAAATVAAR